MAQEVPSFQNAAQKCRHASEMGKKASVSLPPCSRLPHNSHRRFQLRNDEIRLRMSDDRGLELDTNGSDTIRVLSRSGWETLASEG
jgi:hypothetical protein